MGIERDVLNWIFNSGDIGISSKCMAATACGMKSRDRYPPSDPADFNRCLKLVTEVPEIKDHFAEIAKISKGWKSIIDNWDAIEKSFLDEVGYDWCKARSAPKTYKLMKRLEAE